VHNMKCGLRLWSQNFLNSIFSWNCHIMSIEAIFGDP
jgi:hypothetical protein